MKYQFNTIPAMKHYNAKKWWIDRDYIKTIIIDAENVNVALQCYREKLNNDYCIEISNNAMKRKSAMYRNSIDGQPIQTGYVITSKTLFESRSDNIPAHYEYIELWIDINALHSVF